MSNKNSKQNDNVTQMLPNKVISDLKVAQDGQHRCYSCMEAYSDEYDVCPFCGATADIEVENALHMYPGTVLHEKYIIGKVIGYGGFGVTYLAWDTVLQIKVAIKEYLPSEFSTRAMGQTQVTVFSGDKTIQFTDGMGKFLDEAKRLAKFRNESGIVRIFDSFNENGTAYIVMEYLRGETLAERLEREHTIPVEEAIQMLMPIIESLDKVHEEGIIHRDIAPDNIFLTEDGEVKLIDFGAARYATTSRSRSLTVIIKPGYSPEEQYMSRGDQGPHTDVYSVGACLYRMVTGEVPPDAMERHAMFEKNHRDMLKPIRKYVKDIDERRENAIYNALNVRIVDRTPDMVSLAGELLSEEPVKRRKSGIRKIDPLTWPLWAKIGIPASLALVVTLSALLATGVIGPRSNLKSGIVIGLGETLVPNVVGTDVTQAGKKLEKNQLNLQISDKVSSDIIGRDLILLQDPDAFNVVNKGTTIDIIKSEGLGDGTVPSVVGSAIEIARQEMEREGFIVEIVEQPDDVIAPGYVISQSVEPSTLHQREIPITLTVSTGNASIDKTKKVKIPNLVGKTYDEAENILSKLNLYISIEEVYNAEIPVNQVVGQIPVGETDGYQGDIVTLTVNKGQEMVTVVDVREKSLESALSMLSDLGLDVYTKTEESELYKPGTVFKQSIEPGKKVKPGTKITITYSSGKSISVPDVTGMKIKNAEELLVAAGLTVSAEYEPSDTVSKDTVIRQTPAKGTSAKKGDIVVLSVSSGVNGGTGKSSKNNDKGNSKDGSGDGSDGKEGKSAVLVSLSLEAKPAKLIYTVGESLDTAGLRIVASYSDGTKKDVTSSCSFSESLFSTTGGHSITATYKEGTVTKTTSFAVTVNPIKASFAENSVTVKVGSKVALTLNDVPDSAKVTWASKSKQTAEVSSSGEVKGVTVGQTVVTATITVGKSSQSVSCTVYVTEKDIEADSITIDTEELTIYEGNERELTATITPSTVTNRELTWSSSDTKIAKVSSSGVVTGVSEGKCTITVKTSNGKTSKCTVEVKALTPKSIKAVGNFRTTYYPTESFSKEGLMLEITYTDGSKKTVSDGFTVVEKKISNIDSIVTIAYKGLTTTVKIKYNEANVFINGEGEVLVGGSIELTVTTNPAGEKITEWSSSDTSIAKVNAKGVVTGIKAGSVKITAKARYASGTKTITVKEKTIKNVKLSSKMSKTSGYYIGDSISTDGLKVTVVYEDNSSEYFSTGIEIEPEKVENVNQTVAVKWGSYTAGEVTVKANVPSILINKYVTTLDEGKSAQFASKTDPSGASVIWGSTGPVTVDSNGKVTGTGDGQATVTAKMVYNGIEYSDTRNLTAKGRTVSSITVTGNYKTDYYEGDKIDTTGMVVKVTYSDGSTEEKTTGFSVFPDTATSSTIKISYGGKEKPVNINLKNPTVKISVANEELYQGDSVKISIVKTPDNDNWNGGSWNITNGTSVTVSGNMAYAKSTETGRTTIKYSCEYNGKMQISNEISIIVVSKTTLPKEYWISEDSFEAIQNYNVTSTTDNSIDDIEQTIRIVTMAVYNDGHKEAIAANSGRVSAIERGDAIEIDISYDGDVVITLVYDKETGNYNGRVYGTCKGLYEGSVENLNN